MLNASEYSQTDALALLRELVAGQRTGELVCAAESSAVHLYLRRGRVAWGTNSEDPLAFGRLVMRCCGLSKAQLGALVRECQGRGITLSAGLAASGLTSEERLHEALRAQTSACVRALVSRPQTDCMFFDRSGFDAYPAQLAFPLDELLEPVENPASGIFVLPLARADAVRSKLRAKQLFDRVQGCLWAAEVSRGADPEYAAASSPAAPLSAVLLSEFERLSVESLAVRHARGAILGARQRDGSGTLWCSIGDEAVFASAFSTLQQTAELEPPPRAVRSVAHASIRIDDGRLAARALHLLEREADVLGVCTLKDGELSCLVSRDANSYLSPRVLRDMARLAFGSDSAQSPGLNTCLVARSDAWLFGVQLSGGETAWLVSERSIPQGLAWVELSKLFARS